MTTSVKVTCDGCGADLTDAGAMPSYRLALEPEAIPNSGGITYALSVLPPISRPHHFCGFACLDKWRGGLPEYGTIVSDDDGNLIMTGSA